MTAESIKCLLYKDVLVSVNVVVCVLNTKHHKIHT